LETLENKKENLEWFLNKFPFLFDDICKFNCLSLALFIAINFKSEYYVEIKNGKICDYTSIHSTKHISLSKLSKKSNSNWWLKGFDICTKNYECVICFENKSNNIKTQCNHIFCADCLGKHLSLNFKCPYCRTTLLNDRRKNSSQITYYNDIHNNMYRNVELEEYMFYQSIA